MTKLFEELEPPIGGLTRLRARMREPKPVRWWIPVGVVTAAALIIFRPADPKVDLVTPSRAYFQSAPASVTGIGTTAVIEVSSRPDVLFYRVSSAQR